MRTTTCRRSRSYTATMPIFPSLPAAPFRQSPPCAHDIVPKGWRTKSFRNPHHRGTEITETDRFPWTSRNISPPRPQRSQRAANADQDLRAFLHPPFEYGEFLCVLCALCGLVSLFGFIPEISPPRSPRSQRIATSYHSRGASGPKSSRAPFPVVPDQPLEDGQFLRVLRVLCG